MDDHLRQLRRAHLQGDPEATLRYISALERLIGGSSSDQARISYTLRGVSRDVDTWGEEGAGGNPRPMGFRYIDGSFPTLEAVDTHLRKHGLPPLREWESRAETFGEDDDGRYFTSIVEEMAFQAGSLLVDYELEIRIDFSVPFIR